MTDHCPPKTYRRQYFHKTKNRKRNIRCAMLRTFRKCKMHYFTFVISEICVLLFILMSSISYDVCLVNVIYWVQKLIFFSPFCLVIRMLAQLSLFTHSLIQPSYYPCVKYSVLHLSRSAVVSTRYSFESKDYPAAWHVHITQWNV